MNTKDIAGLAKFVAPNRGDSVPESLKASSAGEKAEKAAAAGKDADFVVTIDQEMADVKPVRVAIDRIHAGQFKIVRAAEAVKMAEERGEDIAE